MLKLTLHLITYLQIHICSMLLFNFHYCSLVSVIKSSPLPLFFFTLASHITSGIPLFACSASSVNLNLPCIAAFTIRGVTVDGVWIGEWIY
jgi:hypothetical protein